MGTILPNRFSYLPFAILILPRLFNSELTVSSLFLTLFFLSVVNCNYSDVLNELHALAHYNMTAGNTRLHTISLALSLLLSC